MSKKKRQQKRSTSTKRRKQRSNTSTSLVIPIIVGVVVVAIVIGAIISIENRRPAALAASGSDPASVATAQALSTQTIPNPGVPRISLQETQDKLALDQAVLIDVRSRASYDKAHAAAISIPEEEIDSRLEELPQDKDLVLY